MNIRDRRRSVLAVAVVATAGLVLFGLPRHDRTLSADEPKPLAVSGRADKRLASFDRLMTGFLKKHDLPGASLAVTRNGRLVAARGYGLADRETGRPVEPDSLFRIASISKPITAVAILQLVERERLSLDDRVLDVLKLKPGTDAARLKRVTIRQLLQHTAGWDRGVSFDPMFQPVLIARVLGRRPPAGANDVIRFMMRWPLDFDPGTRYAYSNFGYCLLGRVIEKRTGRSYESAVRRSVLEPLGIRDMRIGRTRSSRRRKQEVAYHVGGERVGLSVFAEDLGERVSRADGAWHLEAMDSHGGWIASAIDLVRFAAAFDDPENCPLLKAGSIAVMFARPPAPVGLDKDGQPEEVYYGLGWRIRRAGESGRSNQWHMGALPGTSTLLVRRHDHTNWAVLFNTRQACDGRSPASAIDPLVHQAADGVKEWPDEDRFGEFLKTVRDD